MRITAAERLGAAAWAVLAAAADLRARGLPEFGVSICPLRRLAGLPCPGCGMGHALLSAFRGRWHDSLAQHPLGIPLLVLWTAWLAWGAANLARDREFSAGVPRLGPRPAWAALVLILAAYAGKLVK